MRRIHLTSLVSGLGGLVGSIGATVVYLKGSAMRLLASSQVNVTTGIAVPLNFCASDALHPVAGYDSEASRATDLLADQVFTSGHNWMSVQIVCEVVALSCRLCVALSSASACEHGSCKAHAVVCRQQH